MSNFIHHYTASPALGGEQDGYNVIETDEISIWHHSMQIDFGFKTIAAAIDEADRLARAFDDRQAATPSLLLPPSFRSILHSSRHGLSRSHLIF